MKLYCVVRKFHNKQSIKKPPETAVAKRIALRTLNAAGLVFSTLRKVRFH